MKFVAVLTFCSTVLSTLSLKNSTCNPSECLMWCPEGFKVDTSGCNICECVEPVNDVTSDLESVTCPDAMCDMECRHGFARDVNGCMVCECEELESVRVAVKFIHEELESIELAAFKRLTRDFFIRQLDTSDDFIRDVEVERSDGTTIKVHFRLMGRTPEALATAVDGMTTRVRQGDGDNTVTYDNTVFVANSVTSVPEDPASPRFGWLLAETWQQVALVAVGAAILIAIIVLIVILVLKRKRRRNRKEKKKPRSNAAYKKAPSNPAPSNKIYLDHVYSA